MNLCQAGLFLLFLHVSLLLQAQEATGARLCIVWYNVENLFNPEDDSLAGDDEFTPEGTRHWSWSRYREKLSALAKVIVAAGRGEVPELVGLCEVENASVLEDLVSHPILAPYNYAYLLHESSDHRGMDVACLFRIGLIDILHWETITFLPPLTATRDMMHLAFMLGKDTLDLFLVHLISKYRGAGATAELRKEQAEQIVQGMDSVFASRSRAFLLAAGDFNDEFDAWSMEPMKKARFGPDSLILPEVSGGSGSYKYRGVWSHIDQFLLSSSLHNYRQRLTVLQLSPLLIEDRQYGGLKPNRTYEAYRYMGGISDHLPLVLNLHHLSASTPAER